MKTMLITALAAILLIFPCFTYGQSNELEQYVRGFSYEDAQEMKIFSKELSELVQKGEVILVDVRFEEEKQSWLMPFAVDITLADLPDRHKELDRDKLIVTACAVKDRSIIAMIYLRSLGYNVRYLDDGLVGFADFLKGGQAKKFKEGK